MISGCIRGVSHDGPGSCLISQKKTESKIKVLSAKTEKYICIAMKWVHSNCTMLGIKAGSVNLPLRKIVFGEKELMFITLPAFFIDPVTCM